MPEYDPTNPPKLAAPDLTRAEVGRDTTGEQPSAWPTSDWTIPEPYAGPVPSREFETSGGRYRRAQPVPAVEPASESNEASIAPPPGRTAQPRF